MNNFRFDPVSFLIGLLSGAALSYIVYRLRHFIGGLRRGAGERAERARRYATRTADARYSMDIRNFCQRYHSGGQLTTLSSIAIEPRFIRGIDTYDTTGDRKLRDVFRVVPMIHKFPASYAAYNIKTMSIADLQASDRHLALLGRQGSGRSTALATIALWAMGEVTFDEVEDIVQLAIEEEEAQLDDKQRAARRKERAEIQARALEQIAHAQEEASTALGEGASDVEITDFHRLMPILIHLGDMLIDPEEQHKLDPAEPLVSAVQHNLRRVTATTVPRYIYNRLNSGQALVLIDGLDDLPQDEQPVRLAWLARFLESYPDCTVIVSGAASGYYPLQQLGLTPIFIRPWTDQHVQQYAQKWAEVWPAATGTRRRPGIAPDELTVEGVALGTRGLLPLDITARLLTTYSLEDGATDGLTRWDWYTALATRNFTVKEFAGNDDLADESLYAVAELAAMTLVEGPLPAERIREHVENVMRRTEGEGDKAREYFVLDVNRFLKMLLQQSGLMVSRAGGRFSFSHPLLAAFLASVTTLDPEGEHALDQVATDPAWQDVISFAVSQAPADLMNRAVVNKLSQQPDLLFTNLFELAYWVQDAPPDAVWRGEVFKRLAAALIAPTQFPILREQAMAALVASRDHNVLFILRQALRSTDPLVRRIGCIGLGALGDSEAIRDLRPMLEDDELEVQLAAGLAMGGIGTEKALEVMVDGLLSGEESLRQAVAEAMASIPGEGQQILHTAAASEDMMVRRAAVFGLARVGTPWALTDLYRLLLEDEQWYVRSAAEQAFAQAQSAAKEAAHAHPAVDELEWVIDWVGEQGLLPPPVEGEDGEEEAPHFSVEVLIQMLQTGEQPYRIASARTLGFLGYIPAIGPLYQSLSHQSPDVRAASYAALSDLQTQSGESLPGVQ